MPPKVEIIYDVDCLGVEPARLRVRDALALERMPLDWREVCRSPDSALHAARVTTP